MRSSWNCPFCLWIFTVTSTLVLPASFLSVQIAHSPSPNVRSKQNGSVWRPVLVPSNRTRVTRRRWGVAASSVGGNACVEEDPLDSLKVDSGLRRHCLTEGDLAHGAGRRISARRRLTESATGGMSWPCGVFAYSSTR